MAPISVLANNESLPTQKEQQKQNHSQLQIQAQNQQQHPFLFQPHHHQYSSGDDGDSPPSLTNSSESPRSVSEEGETSSSRFDIFHGVPQKGMVESSSQGRQDDDSKDGLIEGEGEDSIMSPVQAAGSPNWESVFASSIGTDDVDMSASMAASTMADSKQWNSATPQERENPTHLTSAGTDSSKGIGERQGDAWPSNNPFTNIQQWMPESSNKANDEAMFDSLIQEDSFDASETTEADANQSVSDRSTNASVIGARSAAATTAHEGLPAAASQQALQSSNVALPTMQISSTRASTSALSSRRNSVEAEPKQRIAKVPHCGSHYSHTSDADLPTSSQIVVRPSRAELSGLQVHVHGIAFTGAKSRVETQIRTRIELVRPVLGDGSKQGASAFERIGTFNHVKLPPLTGTKRKSKKHKPSEISAETTLFMDATVVRATPPHDRVLVCASCQQRERKRAQRKRTNSTKKGAEQDRGADEDVYTNEELQEYGIDPAAVDAQEQARQRASLEDEKRVVVFNCGDFINFEEGACVLPTRITCYCRHHKEKTGFCLIFTMRDYKGNLIATGSTPPIMITDDHKSVAAAQAAAASQPLSMSRRGGNTRSRGTSTEALDELPNMRSIGRDSLKKKRNSRARPYGDADDRASRRNTLQSSNMTPPYASTGQNTPALGTSPPSHADMNQTDFWNAFAAMSTLTGSPQGESSQASNGAPTPHESALSPLAQPSPGGHQPVHRGSASQQAAGVSSQDWLANVHSQGSLSSQTLNLCPQSLPGFDLDAFSRSLQQSSQSSSDDAAMQQLFMLARSLPGMESTGTQGGDRLQQIDSASGASLPIPLISKLIPGEGPTSGGIEVTVLGENFTDNLTCVFGDVPATSTKVWGSNTLLCILPPSVSPGPVAVSIKRPGDHSQNLPGQDHYGRSLQLFTYVDTTDRALMELALQVVGLQMTGQMQTARDVAMRVVGSGGGNAGLSRSQSGTEQQQGGSGGQRSQMRSAVPGIFAGAHGKQSFQDGVMQFLTTLDEPVGAQRREAIRLANKQGHTLLHLTTILGFHRLALSLVQRGCPINARDHNGYTALHFAALHGRMTIARMLLSKGARWNVECEAGKYPLDVARERDQIDVELLLEERMGEGAWSEEDETDDDLYEEEDDLSDWMTDESEEVDADNVSTLADDSIGPADSTEEVCAGEEVAKSSVREKTATPLTTGQSTPKADEKKADYSHGALLPVKDGQQEMGRKAMETKTGLKGLVSGGIDFAQKWPLGMPTMLHDRFPLMQMPTVSVFQMVLPPTLMNWAHQQEGDASSSASVAKDKGRSGEEQRQQAPDDASTGLAMWRNIIEESAMWINPLYSPPPTYETALHHARKGVRGDERQSQGGQEAVEPQDQHVAAARAPSRFPAIAEASPDSPHKDRRAKQQQQQRSETSRSSTSRHTLQSSASTSATPSSSSTSRLGISPSPSSSALHSARSTTATTQRHLNEDRMLVYFWLPTLVFVMLLLCFAKPSSVLSYKDLVSFMPI